MTCEFFPLSLDFYLVRHSGEANTIQKKIKLCVCLAGFFKKIHFHQEKGEFTNAATIIFWVINMLCGVFFSLCFSWEFHCENFIAAFHSSYTVPSMQQIECPHCAAFTVRLVPCEQVIKMVMQLLTCKIGPDFEQRLKRGWDNFTKSSIGKFPISKSNRK